MEENKKSIKCRRGFSKDFIIHNFNDETIDECGECENFVYSNGISYCKYASKKDK